MADVMRFRRRTTEPSVLDNLVPLPSMTGARFHEKHEP